MKGVEPGTGAVELGGIWSPYVPNAREPWDVGRVVRLHRGAGFGASWKVIQRDLRDGVEASVGRVLNGKVGGDGLEEFESTSNVLVDTAVGSGDAIRLKAWWIWRMLHTPDPLGERLTLLWHNHFATSQRKVADLTLMRGQNETFRVLARAPFGELLNAMVRDPALLVWLDAPANRKGHPNENLARELMELFTIGVGRFGESDVKEAARALSGSSVVEGRFRDVAQVHDEGVKSILGQKGAWSSGDLVRILLRNAGTAERLAGRICECFLGPGIAGTGDLQSLAQGLRARNLDVGWAVGVVVRSHAFLGGRQALGRVVGPVEFVVGAVSALGVADASTLLLADWVTRMGQDLFHPPNVGGWAGGRSWLGSKGVLARTNFAAGLVGGREVGCGEPLDAVGMARRVSGAKSGGEILDCYSRSLLGRELGLETRAAILRGVRGLGETEAGRRIVASVLMSVEGQLF